MSTKQIDFFKAVNQNLVNEKPFVIFSKPNNLKVTSYTQNSNAIFNHESYSQKGFIFAGFEESCPSIFFPLESCKKESIIYDGSNFIETDTSEVELNIISSSLQELDYKRLVSKTVEHINKTAIDKIVISRKETLQLNNINVLAIFEKMLNTYKSAFVYCWYHPKVGLWMGASPERFLNIENNEFKTMALAGTQEYAGEINVKWEEKEKEEQRFVTEFILDSIKEIFKEINVSEPYTVQAGNLLHLRTDILAKPISSNSIKNLVEKMHPTPAVCGLPKAKAKEFILKNEYYKRRYYTGFLGELNINNNTNFYVNLRCMEIENNTISVYVGGGITARSIPSKEWLETVAKSNVMKKVIK